MFGPPFAPSEALIVDHRATAITFNACVCRLNCDGLALFFESFTVSVGYTPSKILRIATWPALFPASLFPFRAGALLVIVGHKPKTIPKMLRASARGLNRPGGDCVPQAFQVTSHETEPFNRFRNLFSKDCSRARLADEMKPGRP
jgi:hypothetical protein